MLKTIATLVVATVVAGCAGIGAVDSQVSSFSRWPAGRAPATYAFERLPSQQADPPQAQILEDAARLAVESAGFVAAASGAVPDVTVQIGARVTRIERSPFDDPFWYGFGSFGRRYGPYYGPHYGPYYGAPYGPFWGPGRGFGAWGGGYGPLLEDHEVGVLIRDRRSGEALYEARASSDQTSFTDARLLPALFSAALKDFPNGGGANPHRIRIVGAS